MHLGEISFCDKVGFNIKSDEFRKKVLTDLETQFNFKIIQKHFDKYHDGTLQILKTNPHMISLRSNGNPYLLYLTQYNGVNQCIFIDKKIQHGYFYPRMIIVKLWFDDVLFNNTLLDGEMVKDKMDRWTFVIGDIIGDSGHHLASHNLVKRMNRIYEILGNQYIPDELDVCIIFVKRYFHYNEYNYMVSTFMPSLPYTCRGMYFKPLFLKFRDVLMNFDDNLVKKVVRTKYKDAGNMGTFLLNSDFDKHTKNPNEEGETLPNKSDQGTPYPAASDPNNEMRCFSVQKTSHTDIYELHDNHTLIGIACMNNMATSHKMRELFRNTTPTEKIRMNCKFSEKFLKWIPLDVV
jgi:hypothetical protein